MSELAKEAFQELYPGKELKYDLELKYSNHFNSYNANVKLSGKTLAFHFSKDWRKISKDIQKGLIQELLVKILKDKRRTINMDLYNIFLKKVHIAVPKTKNDIFLEESFNRVNDKYLSGMVDRPNLEWGSESSSKLGSYHYASDIITISSIFKDAQKEMLDLVMYHEMLHKKLKFECSNGRTVHHSPEFKKMEDKFENKEFTDKEISKLARRKRFGTRSHFWF